MKEERSQLLGKLANLETTINKLRGDLAYAESRRESVPNDTYRVADPPMDEEVASGDSQMTVLDEVSEADAMYTKWFNSAIDVVHDSIFNVVGEEVEFIDTECTSSLC